jgi:hypothetical protein
MPEEFQTPPAFSLYVHLSKLVQKVKAGDECPADYDGSYDA